MQFLITMEKNDLVESMDFNGDHDLNFYDGCVNCKHHHTQFIFKWEFLRKGISWASAHRLMWSHGNISWSGNVFYNFH
jgi:hypothetical protein